MIVVDSNTLITCFNNHYRPVFDELVVTDDLYDEFLVAEVRHQERLGRLKHVSSLKGYDEAYYLREYAKVLSDYTQLSFAKMRGFADVSILALVACLVTDFGRKLPQIALELGDYVSTRPIVVTDDEHLRKRLKRDFEGQIEIQSYDDFIES